MRKENGIVVDRNNLNSYKLKITTLSPVHIGTGEVYEPTNFVIDKNRFYVFDEALFYKSLEPMDREKFNKKLNDYMQVIDFYKDNKESAKKIAFFECSVSKEVENAYFKQKNKDGTKNKNQLEIQKTFKNPNTQRAIIPGSSIKGMFDTALQIYPRKVKDNDIRQNLILSDAMLLKGGVEIGRADRKHKNPDKESKGGIYQRIEVVKPHSEFIFSIDTSFTFKKIQQELKRFHSERKDSRYEETQKSFVARVGKNEGKNYVVDDGTNVLNNDKKPVATHFLYNSDTLKDEQFGWINIELMSEDEYKKSLDEIAKQEKEFYESKELREKELKDKILNEKKDAKRKALEKQKAKEAEEKALLQAEKEREAELAAMDPVDKLIDSYDNDIVKVIIAMKDGSVEDFEAIKVTLAEKLKVMMQKDPKQWDKAKQKALKRKEYIESLL